MIPYFSDNLTSGSIKSTKLGTEQMLVPDTNDSSKYLVASKKAKI